jgi:hypothetical protein
MAKMAMPRGTGLHRVGIWKPSLRLGALHDVLHGFVVLQGLDLRRTAGMA